jgi:hypothetical protein
VKCVYIATAFLGVSASLEYLMGYKELSEFTAIGTGILLMESFIHNIYVAKKIFKKKYHTNI